MIKITFNNIPFAGFGLRTFPLSKVKSNNLIKIKPTSKNKLFQTGKIVNIVICMIELSTHDVERLLNIERCSHCNSATSQSGRSKKAF